MSSKSVCNHTRGEQSGLPLRGRPILLITHMITDRIRIGLHSVLLPLLIAEGEVNIDEYLPSQSRCKSPQMSYKYIIKV